MATSSNEWKILEWDEKLQNKQTYKDFMEDINPFKQILNWVKASLQKVLFQVIKTYVVNIYQNIFKQYSTH